MKKSLLTSFIIFSCFIQMYATTYYSKSTGNLNTLATWGTVSDGSGTVPLNFTTAGCTYIIVNNTAATISANWAVSGAGSVVQVGDGTQSINFTIPTGLKLTGTVGVMNSSTLTIASTTNPTLGTLSSGSTVNYSDAAAQTVLAGSYYNLILSGSGIKSIANTANSTISNALTINSGVSLQLNTSNTYTLNLNGTLAGSGTITGGANSNLIIGGSGPLGTIIPTAAPLAIRNLGINRASLGAITLGGNVTVSSSCAFSNGVLVLNGNTLTLNGTLTLPVASTNGSITGSATSNLSIGATGISNTLFLTGGAQTFNNLTLNSAGQTLTLGGNLTVSGAYTQTRGIVNINGNTLSLTGTASFASSAANGTTTGSSTSSLYVSASTITNSLFMTVGSQTLGNFTLNSAGKTLTLGTPLSVTGFYTQTNGIVKIAAAQTLSLNGTVIFPAASTNGTITGSATSNLSIAATAITNNLCFTTGSQTLNNFTFNSPAQTLTMGSPLTCSGTFTHTSGIVNINGQTLTFNGPVVFPTSLANGSFTGSSTSSISIATPAGGAITNSMFMTQTSVSTRTLLNLTLNRTGQTLTLGDTLDLVGELLPTAGTFASAGNLVLLAPSALVSGWIGPVGGSVTGNVTVQTYEAGGNTGWTLMGASGVSGATFAQWNNSFFITCPTCPNGDGTAQFGSAFTSIDAYSETAGGLMSAAPRYVGISSISSTINTGQGYWVYLGNGATTTTAIQTSVTGPIVSGNFTMPALTITNAGGGTNATDHGYNLLANPYPASISWTALRAANAKVTNSIWVYNPDLNGYASNVGGVSSPAVGSGGIGNIIPAGQAFYVKVSAATTLTAKESNKIANATQQLLRQSNPGLQTDTVAMPAQPMVFRLTASGNGMKNETAIYFTTNATQNYDIEYDALSMGVDAGFLGITSVMGDTAYAINGLPPLNQNFSIPITAITGTTGSYQITASDLQNLPSGACLKLHDKYMNTDWDLKSGSYNCTLTDTETVSRFILNITIDNSLSVSGSSKNPTCMNSADGKLVASASGSAPWNYYWKDAGNNILQTSLNKTGPDTLSHLNGGSYHVDVNTAGTCSNGTLNFVLQGITSPTALYTTPSNTVALLSNDTVVVSFTNNSTNANTYLWDFGDGTQVTDTNTSHAYTSPGVYLVSLTAVNQQCGDTMVYSQVLTVDSIANTTGIKSFMAANNMQINRDHNGYFVQFNFQNRTQATISVQNLLGEKVTPDMNQENALNQKTYIPLGNTSNNILIISVISSSGEKCFRKIINY